MIRAYLIKLWQRVRASYWFVPSLMVAGATFFAWLVGTVDGRMAIDEIWPTWMKVHDAANARVMLSTIAGSMLGVAGVTFSIVIVALSLASSQFGPRLLINFMRDTGNQVVLGTFVATFVYCILVLRQIGGEGDDSFIPHLAINVAVALALSSLGVLIYFFHHVSTSIQAEHVIAEAGRQLVHIIEKRFPEAEDGTSLDDVPDQNAEGWPEDFVERAEAVTASSTGYLDVVDVETLVELGREHDVVILLDRRKGELIAEGAPLAHVYPDGRLDDELARKIEAACHCARRRGTAEDVQLAVDRLTEIGLRALSPGINDPFTAIACIDRLGAGLARLGGRALPPFDTHDAEGSLRLRRPPPHLILLIDRPCEQLRLYGRDNPLVLLRLLGALELIARCTDSRILDRALRRQTGALRNQLDLLPLRDPWVMERLRHACAAVESQLG